MTDDELDLLSSASPRLRVKPFPCDEAKEKPFHAETRRRGDEIAELADSIKPPWRPASEPTCCGSGCDDCPF